MMQTFEVGIYNEEVRRLVQAGRNHHELKDRWADLHFFEIKARNAQQARARVLSLYPASKGYVITSIEEKNA